MNLIGQLQDQYRDSNAAHLADIVTGQNIEKIVETYKNFLKRRIPEHSKEHNEPWHKIVQEHARKYIQKNLFISQNKNILSTFPLYSQGDISAFSVCLSSFMDHKNFSMSGIFLTELVVLHFQNTKSPKEYLLTTENYGSTLRYFGHNIGGKRVNISNARSLIGSFFDEGELRIKVEGDIGMQAFTGMRSGECEVIGNAQDYCAQGMEGGVLQIVGNCGSHVGAYMYHQKDEWLRKKMYAKPAKIIVEGNATDHVGSMMGSGEIVIRGNVTKDLGSNMCGGSIEVFGSAGDTVAYCLEKEGNITVHKDVGKYPCLNMKGGIVHFNGSYGTLPRSLSEGKVYAKGVCVYPEDI